MALRSRLVLEIILDTEMLAGMERTEQERVNLKTAYDFVKT